MTRLSAGKPVTVDSYTLIPVEETRIFHGSFSDSEYVYASKKPKALVVLSGGDARAYDMEFSEIPMNELVNKTVGLKKLIDIH